MNDKRPRARAPFENESHSSKSLNDLFTINEFEYIVCLVAKCFLAAPNLYSSDEDDPE